MSRGTSRSRRAFLRTVSVGGSVAITGCNTTQQPTDRAPTQTSTMDPQFTETGTPSLDSIEHEKLIGAYYYSWYRPPFPFEEYTPATPLLGYYRSADTAVINQHIAWARNHGINWFNMSWGGRNTEDQHAPQDEDITTGFLEAELLDYITFSIFYESNIMLEAANDRLDFDLERNRKTLRRDFQYLAETFFTQPNYLTIDGRPVLTFYTADSFGGAVRDAFTEATDAIDSDPYLIADVLGGTDNRTSDWIDIFDAITGYNIYNEYVVADGEYADFITYAEREMRAWSLVGEYIDCDVIPTVTPGYNDTQIADRPEDNPVLERSPAGFRELTQRVHDWMDPALDAILITSFNEWPEYTAIEPAESYGTTYLEIAEAELARGGEPEYHDSEGYPIVELDFDRTVPAPEEPIKFTIMLAELSLRDTAGDQLMTFDIGVPSKEPYILDGAFDPTRRASHEFTVWRWLGGPTGRTLVSFDPEYSDAATAAIRGTAPPFADRPITADVFVDGRQTDRVVFEPDDPQTYSISLTV